MEILCSRAQKSVRISRLGCTREAFRQEQPVGPPPAHDLPVACAAETVLFDKAEFGLDAPDVLEPDFVVDAVLCVVKIGRLGGAVKINPGTVPNGDLHGFYIADGDGDCRSLLEGERPVVAVIGNAEVDFLNYFRGS